jgi:histidine triad (HIT) family protein
MSLFTEILNGKTDGEILYEDDVCFAIKDKYPDAPLHLLVIPKKEIVSIKTIEENDLEIVSRLIFVAKNLAKEKGFESYRLQFNIGKKGGQIIDHLHLHILGWC